MRATSIGLGLCLPLVGLLAACDEQPRPRTESQTEAILLQAPDRATVGDSVPFMVQVSGVEPAIVEIIDQELGEDLLMATAHRVERGRYEGSWTPTPNDEGPYTLRAKAVLQTGDVLVSEPLAMTIDGSDLTPFSAQLKKDKYTPTGLKAIATAGLVTLSWEPVLQVTGFYVYRSTSAGSAPSPADRIAEVASPDFVDNGVQDGTTYFYQVSSFRLNRRSKKIAESKPSTEVSAQPGDSEAPVVSISDPAKDTTYTTAQQVTILATASDNAGVVKVEFYDGTQLLSSDLTAPYSFDWVFTGADNGAHAWTAKAYDASANSATSAVRTLTVAVKSQDTTPPTVSITSPGSDKTFTAAQTIQVTASATDDVGVAKLELYQGSVLKKTFASAPYSYSWSINAANNGVHKWTAKAFDAAGNSTTSAVRTLTVDILAVPGPPTGVAAVAGDGKVTVSFQGASNATSHNIYFATTAGVKKGSGQKIAGISSPYVHALLINGVTYHYVVTAVNAAGESVESAAVSATPKAATTPDAGVPDTGGAPGTPKTVTVTANADAYVDQSSPSSNFGGATTLYTDLSPDQHAYLRFDVSNISGTFTGAKLRLYVTNGSSGGPALHQTATSWSESGITWDNRPPATGGKIKDLGSVGTGWIEIDLSSVVKSNGTYSFVLIPTSTNGTDFSSREATNQPQLMLSIDGGGPEPDGSVPSPDTTPPAPDSGPPTPDTSPPVLDGSGGSTGGFSFFVVGDTRSDPSTAKQNFNSMVTLDSKAVALFNTGDITADGKVSQWQDHVDAVDLGGMGYIRRDLTSFSSSYIRYFGVIGNHDIHESSWLTNWNTFLPGQKSLGHNGSDGIWYSVTYGNAMFVVVDSHHSTSTQTAWLAQTLSSAGPGIKWKFVFYHKPIYTCSYKSPWDSGIDWVREFEKYGVDMVFNGHAHVYERTCPIVGGKCQQGGVVYVTTGGGGAGTGNVYPSKSDSAGGDSYDCNEILAHGRGNWHHYCHLKINGNQLTYACYPDNATSNPEDTLTLTKP